MPSVTIKDVARLAGVSPSTVSRVISNHPRISVATVKKVREAMETLGYHPNMMAKSLVSKSTKTLGLVLPRSAEELFANPFFSEVLRGMLAYANQKQYDLLISSANNQQDELETVTRMVLGRRVDGMILMAPRKADPTVEKLLELDFPFVLLGRSLEHPNVLAVNNDNIKASFDATQHLIDQGHTRIGFVSGPPDLVVSEDRLKGYQWALSKAGLPMRDEWVMESDILPKNGFHAVSMVMNLPDRPTAFVVSDDVIAFGMIRELVGAGYQIPEDVSVVGFNNIVLSELSNPPMTTVDIGIYHLGYQAAQHLIRKLQGEEILQTGLTVPHRLVIRQSVRSFIRR
ncbi:LacI family DNA-binding transcriptional regulator [Laceyella putida]|uniref:LacI family DNA-binding transcriptional regulator n=1 Tax=Laceyella putida TaxID=110101 RepID=A0ABW2RFU6_9BACL